MFDPKLKTVSGGRPQDRPAGPPDKAGMPAKTQRSGIPQPGPYPKGHGKTSQISKQEVGLATSPGVCTLMKFLELVHIPDSLLIALYHSVTPALKPQFRWADAQRLGGLQLNRSPAPLHPPPSCPATGSLRLNQGLRRTCSGLPGSSRHSARKRISRL